MRCRTQRMARGRSANLVIPLFLDSIACVTAVTLRPTASRHTHRRFSPVVLPAARSQSDML